MNSRELFQKWWEDFYETTPLEPWDEIYSPEHDCFVDQDIDGQYDAWKASRADIEIELPKYHDYTNQDTTRAQAEKSAYNSGVYDSADAIRAAGLTVKGDR